MPWSKVCFFECNVVITGFIGITISDQDTHTHEQRQSGILGLATVHRTSATQLCLLFSIGLSTITLICLEMGKYCLQKERNHGKRLN